MEVLDMADVLNNNAITALANYILGQTTSAPEPKLLLFVNDPTVDCETEIGDLTPCSATGYADAVLDPDTWIVALPVACVVECSYGAVSFTLTDNGGGQTVYGHAVYDDVVGVLWAATWDTPWVIPAGGGVAEVFPFYTSQQCSG
jgi:hypothetical protein